MNKKMIGLSALAVLSLAACNKNVENGVDAHGNTYAGVTVTVNGSGSSALRADVYPDNDTHQVDNDGSAAESAVSSIYVLMGADQKTFGTSDFVASAGTRLTSYTSQTTSYRLKPWLTASGTKNMAVILNGTSPFNAYKVTADNGKTAVYGQDNPATFDAKKYGEALNEELSSLSTGNAFVMSSKMDSKTVNDGVSKQAVKDADGQNATGEDLDNNLFHFNLERLVCKGIVVKGTALTNQIEDNSGTVDLSSLSFASINGATKIYVLANNSGDRQMTANGDGATVVQDGINGKYNGFESAINGSSVAPTATKAVAQDLVRLGNIGITAKQDGTSGYAPKAVNEADKFDVSKASAVYFLENSASAVGPALKIKLTADQLKSTNDNNGAGYYRFAYAKVYATVKPSKLFYLDGETLKSGDATAAKLAADGTFYQGATDGLLYATPQAAKKNGQTKVFIYNKGRCFYRALWNRQFSDTKHELTTYASTRRNNIYVININKFKKLGMPFDPSDPNDPNLPAPGAKILGNDPESPSPAVVVPALPENSDGVTAVGVKPNGTVDEEAVKKDDPRIDKTETYMAVTATVLKWNVVTRGVDLE